MSKEEFLEKYLVIKEVEENYQTKHKPCNFLEASGECKLGKDTPLFAYCQSGNRSRQP
jgi:rhodanese-related sulfurtransferase